MKQVVFVLMAIVLGGCEQATPPAAPIPSGTTTVSSWEVLHSGASTAVGFDFQTGKTITNPGDSCDLLAFYAISLYPANPGMNAVTPFLIHPTATLHKGFCFIARGGTLQGASTYFEGLKVAPDSVYHPIADNIQANQVWAFQRDNGTFGKILIRNVQTRVPQSTTDTVAVEVTFDWTFQPSGSKSFEP